jgi:serralysin
MSGSRAFAPTGNPLIDPLLGGFAWDRQVVSFGMPDTAAGWGTGYPRTVSFDPDGTGGQDPVSITVDETTGFVALNVFQRAAVLEAMREVESFTRLTLTWNTTNPLAADIRIAMTTAPSPAQDNDLVTPGIQWTAFGVDPGTGRGGDSWFNTTSYNDPARGTFDYQTFFHEIGHTLGLKHPHPETIGGVANTPVLPTEWDSLEFSTMTYRESIGDADGGYQVRPGHYPQSYMMLDILALQTMYGADFTTNAGNTVWRFDPATGQTFRDGVGLGIADDGGLPNTPPINILFRTIWDGGGIDTYDFADYATNLSVNLAPGAWTDTHREGTTQAARIDTAGTATLADDVFARGQVFNALLFEGNTRSLIENAWGGLGHDQIFGNQANNVLEGRNGNDTLEGFAGFDTLNGGEGRDTASWFNAPGGVTVQMLQARAFGTGAGGTDSLISIEDIFGSGFADNITGDNADNLILGFRGNDFLFGRNGNDTVWGGDDNDLIEETRGLNFLYGETGNDTIRPGLDADLVDGGDQFDTVEYSLSTSRVIIDRPFGGGIAGFAFGDTYTSIERFIGSAFDDIIKGIAFWETFEGGNGNDRLEGSFGNDTLLGGQGIDTLIGGEGADSLDGGDGYDGAWFEGASVSINLTTGIHGGEAAGDVYLRIESFLGTAGNDSMVGDGNGHDFYGAAGNDTLNGAGGIDKLFGGLGDDVLQGGDGDDVLYGGGGNDEYQGGNGFDLVSFADLAGPVFIDFAPGIFGSIINPLKLFSIEDIEGSSFADEIWGRPNEANYFRGGAGNDTIGGRGDGDVISGEQGDDTIVVAGFELSVNGDGGASLGSFDTLKVGGGAGVFNWAINSFAVDGRGIFQVVGFEMARGAAGNDAFTANTDNLSFYGEGGSDTLTGGNGNNVLEGGEGADRLFFGGGYDSADYRSDTAGVLVDIRAFIATGGHATGDAWLDAPEAIMAGAGNDSLGGSEGGNYILGRGGNDYLSGYGGLDTLDGAEGADSIEGGLGADVLIGGDGNDRIVDTEGLLLPVRPDDNADDTLFGGAGADTLTAGGGNDSLDGGSENDQLTGGAGDDTLTGGAGADSLLGGTGADVIQGSADGDVIDGEGDGDSLLMDLRSLTSQLVFNFDPVASWSMTLGGLVAATISNVETLSSIIGTAGNDNMSAVRATTAVVFDGSLGNDALRGGAAADVLRGGSGNDRLLGNGEDDLLVGGAGADTMAGGAGADIFRWDLVAEGGDLIQGFVSGQDRLSIDASGFGGGLLAGMDIAAAGRFVAGAAPVGTLAQFLYDLALGTLSWDGDGANAAAPVLIASFGAGTAVLASDVVIVA